MNTNPTTPAQQPLRILRYPEVVRKVGLSRSEIRGRIRAGAFPSPVSLGLRSVGFVEAEIDQYLLDLISRSRA